jgi:hypothetical protein
MADRGLQPERTALSWNRTALNAAALGGVTLKEGVHHHSAAGLTAAAFAFLCAATIYFCGWIRATDRVRPDEAGSRHIIRSATVVCWAAAISAAVAIVVEAY